MKNLVVFDWNGALMADIRISLDSDNYMLKTFGGKKITLREYRETMIIPSVNFYTKHGVKREKIGTEKWARAFHTFFEKRSEKVKTRKYTRKLLEYLYKHNCDMTILSNHTPEGIIKQLKRLKLEKYFKGISANPLGGKAFKERSKLGRLGDFIKKNRYKKVAIIGDSPEEVEIGKELKIKTIALTGGYYSIKRLRKAEPDHMINNLEQAIKILRKWTKLFRKV